MRGDDWSWLCVRMLLDDEETLSLFQLLFMSPFLDSLQRETCGKHGGGPPGAGKSSQGVGEQRWKLASRLVSQQMQADGDTCAVRERRARGGSPSGGKSSQGVAGSLLPAWSLSKSKRRARGGV